MNQWQAYLSKYFTNLVSVLTLAGMLAFGFHYYLNHQRQEKERLLLEERYGKLINTVEDFKQINSQYGQLATAYKNQVDLVKEVSTAWKALAAERGERIKLMSSIQVGVNSEIEKQEKSDYEFKTPNGTNGYVLNELRIAGKDSPPIGYILIQKDGNVLKKNYKFEIMVENVQLKDDLTGKIRIVSRAFLVPLENGLAEKRRPDLKKWKGDKFPLDVTGGIALVDPKEPLVPLNLASEWIEWPFNVNVGASVFSEGSSVSARPTLSTNLWGWGTSKQDLDWKIMHLGINYSDKFGMGYHLTPASYRLFKGLLTNTYLGTGVYGDSFNKGFFIGIDVGL